MSTRNVVTMLGHLLACAGAISSQTIVDPNGGGHYRDLQTAIDAVAPGTVIKVVGGTWSSLRIAKSLTILGAPAPAIAAPATGLGGQQPPAIRLVGSGTDTLTLDNVRIGGPASGGHWGQAGEGITGSGFQSLRITRSTVTGHFFGFVTGDASGAPAIRLSGTGRKQIVLSSSTIEASHSLTDNLNSWGYGSQPGIDAPDATVILLDTKVTGGNSTDSYWRGGPPTASPCPCPEARRDGGAGIVANELFESGSTVAGGKGGTVTYNYGVPPNYSWGKHADGDAFRVPTRVHIPSTISAGPTVLGGNWAISILWPSSSLLLLGDWANAPLPVIGSWLFLDPAAIYLTLHVPNAGGITLPIPNDTSLAGLRLALQLYQRGAMSRPVFSVVGF